MLKNYNYILTIMLYPFLLLLEYLMLRDLLNGLMYQYLILLMILLFIPSFIMSLYGILEDILNSKKKYRIIFLILLPFFYLPIYYTFYISKSEKYLGIIIGVLSVGLSYLTLTAFNERLYNYLTDAYKGNVMIKEDYVYTSSNDLFSINVSKNFRCSNDNIGDYVIFCDKLDDDSFIGVYSYDIKDYSESEISDILSFHLEQTLTYIKENGYTEDIKKYDDIIEINYSNMVILLTQKNYLLNDEKYSLVIIKEMPKKLNDIEVFKKMIATIKFLNYNEEVSS